MLVETRRRGIGGVVHYAVASDNENRTGGWHVGIKLLGRERVFVRLCSILSAQTILSGRAMLESSSPPVRPPPPAASVGCEVTGGTLERRHCWLPGVLRR